jgi:hypothetical protein
MADNFDYSHGAQGDEPTGPLDFQTGDPIPPENFDWWWYTVIQIANNHADILETIDSDGDGKVDAADSADVADSANAVDGGDVNGQVSSAASADETVSFQARTNYPANPDAGEVVFRTDKT